MCVGPVWAGEQTENQKKTEKPQKVSRLLRAVEAGGGGGSSWAWLRVLFVSEVFTTGLFYKEKVI